MVAALEAPEDGVTARVLLRFQLLGPYSVAHASVVDANLLELDFYDFSFHVRGQGSGKMTGGMVQACVCIPTVASSKANGRTDVWEVLKEVCIKVLQNTANKA